jgi:hypothetical protein
MYGRSGYGYMQYVQDSGSAAVMGSVPCRLDLETLCEDQGHRKREITSNRVTPAQVLEVSSRYLPSTKKSDDSTSADRLRIEPRSRHSEIGKRSRGKSLKRDSLNFKRNTAT